jgi:hypothetical protein
MGTLVLLGSGGATIKLNTIVSLENETRVSGDLLPSLSGTYNLGTPTDNLKWVNGYFTGDVSAATFTGGALNITGNVAFTGNSIQLDIFRSPYGTMRFDAGGVSGLFGNIELNRAETPFGDYNNIKFGYGAGLAFLMAADTGECTFYRDLTLDGNLDVNGTTIYLGSNNHSFLDRTNGIQLQNGSLTFADGYGIGFLNSSSTIASSITGDLNGGSLRITSPAACTITAPALTLTSPTSVSAYTPNFYVFGNIWAWTGKVQWTNNVYIHEYATNKMELYVTDGVNPTAIHIEPTKVEFKFDDTYAWTIEKDCLRAESSGCIQMNGFEYTTDPSFDDAGKWTLTGGHSISGGALNIPSGSGTLL